jgi:hypothetical protein
VDILKKQKKNGVIHFSNIGFEGPRKNGFNVFTQPEERHKHSSCFVHTVSELISRLSWCQKDDFSRVT